MLALVFVREFSAGVEHRQDHFERRLLEFRVLVDRNSAPVVPDAQRSAVFVQRDGDVVGRFGQKLVDGGVDDLPPQVV